MLVFSMMFSLIACGGDENDDTDDTDNTGDNTDTPGDDDDVNSDDTNVNYDSITGGEGIELPVLPLGPDNVVDNTPTEGETEEGTEQPEA
jgi:hypothetical protein